MTICISAISGTEHVVVASDRMVTLNIPSTQFEGNVSKTLQVTKNCVAATAGSALAYLPIHSHVQKMLQAKPTNSINEIAEYTKQTYSQIRSSKLEQDILSRIGIANLDVFYKSNRIFAPEVIANVVGAMQQYNYGLSVLIAGVDEAGPHLFRIDDPGRIEVFDTIGHCSVGSGELHAISTFIANDYAHSLDLDHIVAMVYEAKRRSEKAVGVGQETDICIVCNDGTVKVSEDKIKKLDLLYDKKISSEKNIVAAIEDEVKILGMSELNSKDSKKV